MLERGAPADLARAWSSFARTSIELIPEDVRSVDDTALRASKLSDAPDLPIGADWPSSAQTSKPLAFIAQINLRDVASIGCDLPIPHEGHLLFFYDEEEQPWGFDPRQAGGWRVMFVGANAAISRQQGNANHSPRVRLLRLSPSENLPPWEWLREKIANESWYDRDVFFEAIEKVELYGAYNHQFGGWPIRFRAPWNLNAPWHQVVFPQEARRGTKTLACPGSGCELTLGSCFFRSLRTTRLVGCGAIAECSIFIAGKRMLQRGNSNMRGPFYNVPRRRFV